VEDYKSLIVGDDIYTLSSAPRLLSCYSNDPQNLIEYFNGLDLEQMSMENKKAILKALAEAYLENNNYSVAFEKYMILSEMAETEEEQLQAQMDIELCRMYEQINARMAAGTDISELQAQKFNTQRMKVTSLRNQLLGRDDYDTAYSSDNQLPYSPLSNYPNPFNPVTTINYSLQKDATANISVYNLLGQKVITLLNERKNSGDYQVRWDGKNSKGNNVSSGVYFYKLEIDGKIVDKNKMLLVK